MTERRRQRPFRLDVPYRQREQSVTMEPLYGTEAVGRGRAERRVPRRAAHPQHRPAPPGHPRRAAPADHAPGRGGARREADHRLRAHRDREELRGPEYWKAITFVERMDYLAYYYNAMAFCMSVERLAEVEVPERAQWLRVIHLELNRIASHLFWIATAALDIGAITMLWWGLPRARLHPRPLRDVGRPAPPHAVLPGRRRGRGHPARLRGQGPRVPRDHAAPDRPVRVAPRPERDLAPAHEGHRDHGRGHAARAWA